jgi:hypothetical protein
MNGKMNKLMYNSHYARGWSLLWQGMLDQIMIVRSLYKVLKISAEIFKVAISKTIVDF